MCRPAPDRSAGLGEHGHARPKFLRALETGSLVLAELGARECGVLSLDEAAQLTALVALKDPPRAERFARRWFRRWHVEHHDATLGEIALVVGCLAALGGPSHAEALGALRSAATRATRR